MKKHLLCMLIIVTMVTSMPLFAQEGSQISVATSERQRDRSAQAHVIPADPFEKDLMRLHRKRASGSTMLAIGLLSAAVGFIGGSTITTVHSLGYTSPQSYQVGSLSAYAVVSLSSVLTLWGFFKWKSASDNYLDTLRLQSTYNNLIY